MNPEIIVSSDKDPEFEDFVHQQIKAFNNVHSPFHLAARKPGGVTALNIIIRDGEGQTIGGLAASTYWGWLVLEDFYIPEVFRGSGLGSRILNRAEELAVERGCRSCHLTTYNFQAKDFYEKRGYIVVGKLDGYPPGSVYYWMRKDFV